MKKSLKSMWVLATFALYLFPAFGQSPNSMSYQAVVRNSSDVLVTNTQIGMEINIRQGSVSGTVVYTETQTPTTNANGLVSIEIGSGTDFSTIDWSAGPYFIETKTDPTGGTNYTITGTSQLLSVPYALHAKTAETLTGDITETDPIFTSWDKSYNDLTNKPNIKDTVTTYGFSGNYNDLANKPTLFDSNYQSLSNKPNIKDTVTTYGFSGSYNDLTNKPTLFNGNYQSLTDKPNLKDTVTTYGFSGSYNDLANKPTLFDSNYQSLSNKPNLKDTVTTYGFSGSYNDLANKPTLFDSNYQSLTNKPNIKDTVTTYGFSGSYNDLANKPTLFDSNYQSLTNKPNIKDTVATYGFSGSYNDITNKPSTISGYGITDAVATSGNQTIAGNKTLSGTTVFTGTTTVPTPVNATDAATKAYVDELEQKLEQLTWVIEDVTNRGILKDSRDGNQYKTVKIGTQIWMAENLKYLPSVVGSGTGSTTAPYYYVYGYNGTDVAAAKATANYTTYGVLYNWPAAMAGSASSAANPSGVQGVCPCGWHLPSDTEWTQLTGYLGGTIVAGGKLKETGTTHWNSPNGGATNETGFTALPGGDRTSNGTFSGIGIFSYWWSTTEGSTDTAWGLSLNNVNSSASGNNKNKDRGFSVRCVKD